MTSTRWPHTDLFPYKASTCTALPPRICFPSREFPEIRLRKRTTRQPDFSVPPLLDNTSARPPSKRERMIKGVWGVYWVQQPKKKPKRGMNGVAHGRNTTDRNRDLDVLHMVGAQLSQTLVPRSQSKYYTTQPRREIRHTYQTGDTNLSERICS